MTSAIRQLSGGGHPHRLGVGCRGRPAGGSPAWARRRAALWQGEAMSTLLEQYDHADGRVRLAGRRRSATTSGRTATPCTDWDVRALVAHLVDECRWVPYLIDGGTVDGAGDRFAADPLGDDPKAAWHRESAAARERSTAEGALDRTVTVSYGEISARDYLWQLTVDLTVHAWDLARGIGADEQLDHELVRRIHAETEKDTETLAKSGLFDPPVHVPAHADLQARMLGLFGRRTLVPPRLLAQPFTRDGAAAGGRLWPGGCSSGPMVLPVDGWYSWYRPSGSRMAFQRPSCSSTWWPSQGSAPLSTVCRSAVVDGDQVMGVGPADGPVAERREAAVAVAGDDRPTLGGGEEPSLGAGFDDAAVRPEGDEGGQRVTPRTASSGPGDPADPGQRAARSGVRSTTSVAAMRCRAIAVTPRRVVAATQRRVVDRDDQVGVATAAAARRVGVGQVAAGQVGQRVEAATGGGAGVAGDQRPSDVESGGDQGAGDLVGRAGEDHRPVEASASKVIPARS